MARDIIARYTWIVDTILRYKKITKQNLSDLWMKSRFSGGNPMADRTFYKYRRGIEDSFGITLLCDNDGAYYIDEDDSPYIQRYADWVLNNSVAANAIQGLGSSGSDVVEMEDIPSSRKFLPVVSEAMSKERKIVFTYAGFSRSRPEVGILFSPFFLKLYKQRWYMFGLKDDGSHRTYALDRVTEMEITSNKFKRPAGWNVADVFGNIIGITLNKGPVRDIVIQTNLTRAKYLRALPLHHSQMEEVHDFYSVFHYRLKINYELVSELMAMGPDVTVIAPRELQIMLMDRLRSTIENYSWSIGNSINN